MVMNMVSNVIWNSLMLAAALSLQTGCVAPLDRTGNVQDLKANGSVPVCDDYIVRDVSDFATRANPDPSGRKFRIAYLTVFAEECSSMREARNVISKCCNLLISYYFVCRKQAADSPGLQTYSESSLKAYRRMYESYERGNRTTIPLKLKAGDIPRKNNWEFFSDYPSGRWLKHVNEELEKRYPNVFSSSPHAFPLDAIQVFAYDASKKSSAESVHEVWLLGLPEHGNIPLSPVDYKKKLVATRQAFTDPYEAIAAALFSVPSSSLAGIQPMDPEDHAWR